MTAVAHSNRRQDGLVFPKVGVVRFSTSRKRHLTLYKAVACILPLKGTVTETGGGSYIATIDK